MLHIVGSLGAALIFNYLLWWKHKGFGALGPGLLLGYGMAWVSHFFIEKNKPATFKYPLYSFIGDWAMLWRVLTLQVPLGADGSDLYRKL